MYKNPIERAKNRRVRWIVGIVVLILILGAAIPWGKTADKIHADLAKNGAKIANAVNASRQKISTTIKSCTELDPLLAQTTLNLNPEVKDAAAQQIKDCQEPLINDLTTKYKVVQDERRSWYAWGLLVVLPLAGFFGFMLFPLFQQSKVQNLVPGVSQRRLYKLYFVQALVATVMLLVLGACLWFCQFWLSSLGTRTNPQLILQEEEINYVASSRIKLVRKYPEIYVPVAKELAVLPDEAMLAIIMESGLQQRSNDMLALEADLINFTWPTFSFIFFGTFSLVLFLFLQRVWPQVKNMLSHPLDLLAAEQQGQVVSVSTWQAARRMIVVELKVMGVFTGIAIVLSLLVSLFLQQFFSRTIQLLIENMSGGMTFFVRLNGAPEVVATATFLILVFLVECVLLFMFAFACLMGKITDCYRERFRGDYSKKANRKLIRYHFVNFLWFAILAVVLSIGLSLAASLLTGALTDAEKPQWVPTLLGVPVLLLLGFNLGMWLLRGLDHFRRLLPDMFNPTAKTDKLSMIQSVDAVLPVPTGVLPLPVTVNSQGISQEVIERVVTKEIHRRQSREERRVRRGR